jgi:hypothetical protein
MYHTIEFAAEFIIDRETSAKQPLERILVRKGTRANVQLRPYVVESDEGPVEVADLFFEDGSATRTVRYECFSFVD